MTGPVTSWLAKLSDPAGPNPRWFPPPFGAGEAARVDELLELAALHNVRPVVVANLATLLRKAPHELLAGGGAPGEAEIVLARAQEARLADLARALLLEHVAGEVLSEAKARDIPVALVKGLDFAQAAYGGLQYRTFSDIDLLVRPADEERLGRVLDAQGFEVLPPHKMRLEKTERQWIRPDNHGNVVLVEVHTDLVHDPAMRRYMTLTYDQYADPALGGVTPAARLVVAAVHGAAGHLFGRLQYVVDGLVIARTRPDPRELLERARRSGALLPLATMLRLAIGIYDCDECRQIMSRLPSPPWDFLQRRLISPSTVLSGKGAQRWALLPQRYLYRRLLKTGL